MVCFCMIVPDVAHHVNYFPFGFVLIEKYVPIGVFVSSVGGIF